MDLEDLNVVDRQANAAVTFYPAVPEEHNNGTYAHPMADVGGADVSFYIQQGVLHVSIGLEGAGTAFRKYGPDGDRVPVVVSVGPETVFEAGPEDGELSVPATIMVRIQPLTYRWFDPRRYL